MCTLGDLSGLRLFAFEGPGQPQREAEHLVTTSLSAIKIDIWSDVACPWCYLGKRRLERALESFAHRPEAPPVEVEYHSYQLNPDLPADFEGGHSEYLQAAWACLMRRSQRRTEAWPKWERPLGLNTTWTTW
jgi:predicted DsbA family dithiol-disulfide isomerase